MTNLTIALEESLLREARVQALTEGTTLNALVREYLTNYVHRARRSRDATASLLELARRHGGTLEPFLREELHER